MSGVAPYVFQDVLAGSILAAGHDLLYLYDKDTFNIIVLEGVDLFSQGCFVARYTKETTILQHPENAYQVDYPYCRTALRYRMDDHRSDPQIGQLVAVAPFVSIRVTMEGCDQNDIASVTTVMQPLQPLKCAAEMYPGYAKNELYVVVDATRINLPARVSFTVTNVNGIKKTFWIGIRAERDGPASGTVV